MMMKDKPKCPHCGELIDVVNGFVDSLSLQEFIISGMCQRCQDETFGACGPDNEECHHVTW